MSKAPVIAEPVVGTVTFGTSQASLTAYPIGADGVRGAAIPLRVTDGAATLELEARHRTIFYEITSGG